MSKFDEPIIRIITDFEIGIADFETDLPEGIEFLGINIHWTTQNGDPDDRNGDVVDTYVLPDPLFAPGIVERIEGFLTNYFATADSEGEE